MEKIYFKKYINELKNKYKINESKFEQDLVSLLVSNNWFSEEPEINDGILYVSENFIKKSESVLHDFCKYYYSSISDKNKYLFNKLETILPKTKAYFQEYCNEKKLKDENVYYLLDFLLYFLPGEIHQSTDKEIEFLLEDAYDNITKQLGDILCDFLTWLNYHYNTVYSKCHKMNKRDVKRNFKALDIDRYTKILYCLFNKNYIEKNNMYEKAAKSKRFIDAWLFLSTHFLNPIRNTDIVRIPHPRLTMKPEEVLSSIINKTFSDEDAIKTLNSVFYTMNVIALVPHKTRKIQNVSSIKFNISDSCKVHMGKLFAIAEAHYLLAKEKKENLIKTITTYKDIKVAMGDEIGELFLEADFNTKSVNKSLMQTMLYIGNEIDDNEKFHVKGYVLVSLARSHKGSYDEFAKVTAVYLKDHNMSAYSPDFIAMLLLERGVLSFVSDYLLKILYDEEYEQLSITAQTRAIKQLGLSSAEIERIVTTTRYAQKRAIETVKRLFASIKHDKNEVFKILFRICNGDAAAKQYGCLCLMSATNKVCPYENRQHCIGCEYEISTKTTLDLLIDELSRIVDNILISSNELEKKKDITMLYDVLFPILDSLLYSLKEKYGEKEFEQFEWRLTSIYERIKKI